jgi:hypothetical protein
MKDTQYLIKFVNDVLNDDYAHAKDNLQTAISEKLKGRMKEHMQDELNKGE